jgi:hypothetical protein
MFHKILCPIVLVCLLAGAAIAEEIAPLAMSNRSLGGKDLNQYTLGVFGGRGPNNIGLLIKTWGKVTYVDTAAQYFYIDDGASLVDGTRRPDNSLILGVRVSYGNLAPDAIPVTPPNVNDFAVVTGISSTVMVNDQIRPNVRVPKGTNVQTFH